MTKAQQIYERVEALVAEGTKKADAFRQVAEELGQPFNSMRGAYYAHSRSLNPAAAGETTPRRRRDRTPADPIAAASALLEQAIEMIDRELETARERADAAQAAYQQLLESAEERKHALQAKIDNLTS